MAQAEQHPVAWLPDKWRQAMADRGQQAYRARQIFHWIHRRGVTEPSLMTDLPQALRAELARAGLQPPLRLLEAHESADGARKLLLASLDGALSETVLLPRSAKAARDDADAAYSCEADDDPGAAGPAGVKAGRIKVSQCVSTQVGCAMGCVFCASGAGGLQRNLSAAEIVGQVLLGLWQLRPGEALGSIMLMGAGEPLHSYDATAQTIRLLAEPEGLGLSPRRITVSTCGLVPQIRRLGADFGGRVGLAISLHEVSDEHRAALSPVGRRYPLAELLAALRDYPLPHGRKITVEYTLMEGRNDSAAKARQLGRLLRGLPAVKVNLIPLNPIAGSPLRPPAKERVQAFQQQLTAAGLLCFVRRRRGNDVAAACGQLAAQRTP